MKTRATPGNQQVIQAADRQITDRQNDAKPDAKRRCKKRTGFTGAGSVEPLTTTLFRDQVIGRAGTDKVESRRLKVEGRSAKVDGP